MPYLQHSTKIEIISLIKKKSLVIFSIKLLFQIFLQNRLLFKRRHLGNMAFYLCVCRMMCGPFRRLDVGSGSRVPLHCGVQGRVAVLWQNVAHRVFACGCSIRKFIYRCKQRGGYCLLAHCGLLWPGGEMFLSLLQLKKANQGTKNVMFFLYFLSLCLC